MDPLPEPQQLGCDQPDAGPETPSRKPPSSPTPTARQYGQQAGAQVNYVTKSGTNAFHGNAQYWWTGSSIQANSYFAGMNSPVPPTPFTNNNEWAASISAYGPIKKDKLFFFLDYEGISYDPFLPT